MEDELIWAAICTEIAYLRASADLLEYRHDHVKAGELREQADALDYKREQIMMADLEF